MIPTLLISDCFLLLLQGIPLLYVPLEVIMSKYYGESERLLGNVFSLANELPSGAIIFLDEVHIFISFTLNPSFISYLKCQHFVFVLQMTMMLLDTFQKVENTSS